MKNYFLLFLFLFTVQLYAQIPIKGKKTNLAVGTSISLTAVGTAYSQNFNTLSSTAGSTTNNLTITGWYLTETGGGARDNEQYAVDTGGSNTGDTYSYGSSGNSERALGGLQSGSLIPTFGAAFTNNTGSSITQLEISYVGEQWRLGATGRADRIDFQYSTDATSLTTGTWNDVNDLDFSSPITTGTTGALNGNDVANRVTKSFTITGINIPNGSNFWIKWTDLNATSSDDGLAVDDFSITPNSGASIPNPPVAINAENVSANGFTAKWNASAGATKYYLDVSTSNTFAAGSFVPGYENKDVGANTSQSVSGLTENTPYHYRVRAFNEAGTSDNSNTITVNTTAVPIPDPPNATNATAVSSNGFTANWDASAGVTKYYLDVSTSNDFSSFVGIYNNLDVLNSTSYNVTGLSPLTQYHYRLRANNASGTSGNSNVVSVTTSDPPNTDLIVNEWSQGTDGAKEWVEILVVTDHFNMQNYKLVDGSGSLSITFSGSSFQNVRKGTLIVIYNGADPDGIITSDLTYNGTTDKNLVISSLNNSGGWAVTRNTGWSSASGAFSNGSTSDLPKIQNNASTDITYSPRSLSSNQYGYYTGNTSSGAVIVTNWNTGGAVGGNPGLPNGGDNSTWINTTLATEVDSAPDAPIANNASDVTTNSFTANWSSSSGATKYFLDVATDNTFNNILADFNNKDVGASTSFNVTGLTPGNEYHYRVRAFNSFGTSDNSNIISQRTNALTTTVQFNSTKGRVSESAGTYNLVLDITNPDPATATTLEVVIISGSGNASDINNYTTQTVTFDAAGGVAPNLFKTEKQLFTISANGSSSKNLTLTLTNDNIFEGHETILFEIQNVSGGSNAQPGTNRQYELTLMDPVDPNYYNSINGALTGTAMKNALHSLIKGHREYPYTSSLTYDVWDILMDAYEDQANMNNVILIYSGRSQAKTYNASTFGSDQNAWNREHVFAQSRAGFDVDNANDNPGPASDAHNLAPEDASINTDRSNRDFDIGGVPHTEAIGSKWDSDSWEPMDAVKGDIARILFYMDTRYEGDDGEQQLELMDDTNTPVGTIGKLSTLLLWHRQDPPDAFEVARNNMIYTYQANKNPFIDHPEWVESIYGSNSAPVISNINRSTAVPNANQDLIVTADIIDDGNVTSATLLYSINNGPEQSINMTNGGAASGKLESTFISKESSMNRLSVSSAAGNTYTATILEAAYNDGTLLKYRIKAVDNNNNERYSSYSSLFTGITNISVLHSVDASGAIVYNKTYARISGTATVSNGVFSTSSLETVMQDDSGGMTIYKVATTGVPFTANRIYTVTGSLTQFNGLAELVPDNVATDIVDSGPATQPSPKIYTISQLLLNPEPNESRLTKIKNVSKVSGIWAGGQTLVITDGTANLNLHLDSSVGGWGTEPVWPKDLIGIFSQYDTATPFTDNYQIKPRSTGDILPVPSSYWVNPSNLQPSVGSQISIMVQLLDNNSQYLKYEGRVVNWSSTNGGIFSSATSVLDADGRATVYFTVSSVLNTKHVITVTDNTEPGTITGSSVDIVTVGGIPTRYQLSINNPNPAVGNNITVTAQLLDQYNNPLLVAGKSITWTSTNGGSFTPGVSTTDANGIATTSFEVNQISGTTHLITATDNSTPTALIGTSNPITTIAGEPDKYVVTSSNYNPLVGTEVTISAQLVDQYGNNSNTANKIITWTSTWGGSFSSTTSTTNNSGLATVIFTVNQAAKKNHKVTATDNTSPAPLKGTSEIIATKTGEAVKYLVTPSTKIPRSGSTITVTAQLSDQYDNEVEIAGKIISWSSTNGGIFSATTGITDNEGKATVSFTVSQTSSTTHVISVADNGNPVLTGTSDNIKTIVDLAAKYILTATNLNPPVGTIISITAQLADQYNNHISTSGKILNWTSTNGGTFSTQTSNTNSSGRSTVNFTVSQSANTNHSITVIDNSSPIPLTGTINDIITLSGTAAQYLITVSNNNPVVGSVINLMVQLVDGFNNPINSANKILEWSSTNGGQFSSITTQTDQNGRSANTFTVSNKSQIVHLISVKDNSTPNVTGTGESIITQVGPAVRYLITSNQFTVLAGTVVKIGAQIVDQFENPVGTAGRSVIWGSTNGGSFSSTTTLTDANGYAEVNFTTSSNHNIKHVITAEDITGLKGSSSEIVTYILKPEKPTLLSPLNDAVAMGVTSLLTWSGSPNSQYKLQVSKDASFNQVEMEFNNISNNSYAVESLLNKTKYFWRVQAFNEVGTSDFSAPFNFTTIDFINEPSELDYTFDSQYAVNLFWKDNANNEEGFFIEKANGDSDEFGIIGLTNKNIITYKDAEVQQGKKYKYRVTAFNYETVSTASNILEVTIPLSSISAPTNFTFRPGINSKMILNWLYGLGNILGFRIERLTISGLILGAKTIQSTADGYQLIATLPPTAREYIDETAKEGVLYNYRITAFNSEGYSLPVTFPVPVIIFNAPVNLKVTLENLKHAKLDWNDLSTGEEGFEIFRAEKSLANFKSIFKTEPNAKQYVDTSTQDGKKYYYRVMAFAGSFGLSNYSNEDSLLIAMKSPTNLRVAQIPAQNKMRLTWKDNSKSESGYIIERKLSGEAKFTYLNKTVQDAEIFIDESVINKQNYVYRVKGFNDVIESGYSNAGSIIVGIDDKEVLPAQFALYQNYPNPFNPETVIKFEIPEPCNVTLKVYDMLGREVSTLLDEYKQAGIFITTFNAATVPSGVYFCRIIAGKYSSITKMLLLR